MTDIRKWPLAAAALIMMFVLAGAAKADTVNSFLKRGDNPLTDLNEGDDNNAEYLLVDDDGGDGSRTGYLDIGDVLVGAIDINTLNSTSANLGGSTGNHQWTAVFALEVKDLRNVTTVGGVEFADIVFGAYSGFSTFLGNLNGGSGPSDNPSVNSGTIARFWTNSTSTTDFLTDNSDPDVNVATAATGSFYWDIGFADESAASHWDSTANGGAGGIVSDNGEGWVVFGGQTNVGALAGASAGTKYTESNFGLNVLKNDLGPGLYDQYWTVLNAFQIGATAGDGVQIIGSSTVKGGAGTVATAGFQAASDSTFTFLAAPLPTAVFPGIGLLLGLGVVRSRRRRMKAGA
jgi:hypothetical protein